MKLARKNDVTDTNARGPTAQVSHLPGPDAINYALRAPGVGTAHRTAPNETFYAMHQKQHVIMLQNSWYVLEGTGRQMFSHRGKERRGGE